MNDLFRYHTQINHNLHITCETTNEFIDVYFDWQKDDSST